MALLVHVIVSVQLALTKPDFSLPFGQRPLVFISLMMAIGLLCSWLGTFCWNQVSQRLPTVLVKPLIVFETLAGLTYTFMLRQAWPPLLKLCGIFCLLVGVVGAMRTNSKPVVVKVRWIRLCRKNKSEGGAEFPLRHELKGIRPRRRVV